jgi:hypothetical protein
MFKQLLKSFVTFYGKNTTEKEVIASVRGHVEAYENRSN